MSQTFDLKLITPTVRPLPQGRRRFVFVGLLFLFLFAVPLFVFYATGYRYDFFSETGGITATGGLYISILSENGELYLDEVPVRDVRIFRKASYIQNLTPGMHRVHVQEPGLNTWVKELPVYPYIVTEAEAFLLPVRPQIRLITEYQTSTGSPVFFGMNAETQVLPFASTTLPITIRKSRATSTLTTNSEYDFVLELFNLKESATSSLLHKVTNEVVDAFKFADIPTSLDMDAATTTRLFHDIELYERSGEIYARYVGLNERDIPYYFCVPQATLASTSEMYGAQVMRGVAQAMEKSPIQSATETSNTARICRSEIKIDTHGQSVVYFDFLPNSSDLVLLHLEDGIFVVEIDDRSWQNTQQLYPASADRVVVSNGAIYVEDHGIYFELLTSLITP